MRTFVAIALGLSAFVASSCSSPSTTPEPEPPSNAPSLGVAAAPGGTQEQAADDASEPSLQEQKERFLVDRYLASARTAMAEARFEDAEAELARAAELAPDDPGVRELSDEIALLLGRDQEEGAGAQHLKDLYLLRKEQAETDARANLAKARVLRERGDHDGAIAELTLCLDIVTLSSYAGAWKDIEQEANSLLETVKAERDQALTAQRQEAQRKAREELQRLEREEKQRRKKVLADLLDQAVEAFKSEDYDESIVLADRVLRLDPRNEMALDIRDTAFRKGRQLVRGEALRKKREQYTLWQEEMEELRIPYEGIMTLPDIDRWNEISELRRRRPGLDLDTRLEPGETELRAKLASTELPGFSVDEEESLTTVVQSIQLITSLPIVVDPLAEDAALTEGVVFDFDLTNPLSAEKALSLVTQLAGPEVTWTLRHGTVLVTTVEKARGDLVVYNHDVQDLTFGLTDFLGPRIDRLRLIDELEDDDGGSPFGSISDEKPQINDPDELLTLVQENVAVDSWEDDGISITVEGGNMVVVHTAEVQERVRIFLDELRRFSSSLVTIESKFLTLREGFIQEIGVEWRGLDGSVTGSFSDLDDVNLNNKPTLGLDNSGDGVTLTAPSAGAFLDDGADGQYAARTEHIFESALGSALSTMGGLTAQYTLIDDLEMSMILHLVEKSQNAEIINDQVLSVLNTQRAYVTVVNQRAFVQDFDVEVAQFQAIADPVINTLMEGIVLDVRPTIDHSRKYLTLEIQPTVAQVVSLTNFSTTLAGQTAAVTFQLPELEVQSVFTTAVVPDGGSILIGGLSRLRNIERRAEVPFLAKIPLLGFFFKEEGYNDERESLMISLRAWITDVKDELAALER